MKDTRENKNNFPARPFQAKWVAALTLAAALMAGAASCKKDKGSASPSTGEPCFVATVESHTGDGKTQLGSDGRQVVWTDGDKVAVYNRNGAYGLLVAEGVTNDGKTATLNDKSGGEFSFLPSYKAVYPRPSNGAETACEGNAIKGMELNGGGVQEYATNNFAQNANPMAASSENDVLSFHNLCGLLKVPVKGNGTVKCIRITSNDPGEALWGGYSVLFNDAGVPEMSSVDNDAENKHVLTMYCNVTLNSTAKNFYFVLPPGTLKRGFTIETVDDYGLATFRKKTTSEVAIKKNYITGMAEVEVPVNASTGENLAGDDNSRRANCYIINKVNGLKDYKFPCNIKGNGVRPEGNCIDYLSDEQKSPVLSGYKSAEIVWQTNNAASTVIDVVDANTVQLEGDYVYFQGGAHEGNALIAVKDAFGDILWSWHIWCVKDEYEYNSTEEGKSYKAFELNGRTLMDRNLGALSGNPTDGYLTAGLLYQWGRKDPLMGAASLTETTKMVSSPTEPDSYSTTTTNASDNVAHTIQHPGQFVAFGVNSLIGDWFNNTAGGSNGLWAEKKTMYDPCPYGWRVPEIGTFENGVLITDKLTWGNGGNWESLSDEIHGRYFKATDSSEETLKSFYPASGYRDSGTGTYIDVGVRAFSFSCSATLNKNVYSLGYDSSKVYTLFPIERAVGFSVRPVLDSSSASK